MRPAEGKSEGQDDPVKGQQLSAMRVLSELINGKAGVIPPPECEIPSGLKAIKLDTWRLRLVDKTVIEGKNTAQLFSQLKTALLNKGEIDISAGFVWPKFD
jgi:hypothetical protein